MDLELNSEIFNCQECHYNTSRKSQWTRHLKTNKHSILTNTYKYLQKRFEHVRIWKSYIPITPFYILISIDAPSQYIQVVSLEASGFL